jgi:ABC-type protease/lipase transport system fused ATPase/permease subunit
MLLLLPLLLLLLPPRFVLQIADKAEKLEQLRTAVEEAGYDLPDKQLQQALVSEAVEQFRRNNAVVAEFQVGWRAVLLAVQRVLYRLLKSPAVVAAVVVLLVAVAAAAAGVRPSSLFTRQ